MKKAKITIRTVIEGQDAVEFTTLASYESDAKNTVLIYEESEVTGLDETITKLLFTDSEVTVERRGKFNSVLNFSKDRDDVSLYHTPYGSLRIIIKTDEINIFKETDSQFNLVKAEIRIKYRTEIEGESQGTSSMHITVVAEN